MAHTDCIHCYFICLSPLLPATLVVNMHTKTDFAGAARELLGIVCTASLCVSSLFLPLFLSLFN